MQVDGARVREPTINNPTLKDLVNSFNDFTNLTFFKGFKRLHVLFQDLICGWQPKRVPPHQT